MYALIHGDSIVRTTDATSFFWNNLTYTAVNLLSHEERKNALIYTVEQKYPEQPENTKEQGDTLEIDHRAGVVYRVPIYVPYSQEELDSQADAKIQQQIEAIESKITSRRFREAFLSDDGRAWLAAQDFEIDALRKQKKPKQVEVSEAPISGE